MVNRRVIPVLLFEDFQRLTKTVRFKKGKYVGDPVNAIKIFNEKEVDELIVLDIEASKSKRSPNLEYITEMAGECFMPLCYGGGVKNLDQIQKILYAGVEKVSINSAAIRNRDFVKEAVIKFGSSTIVVSIDVKKDIFGKYKVYDASIGKKTKIDPVQYALELEELGIGELLLNSVDRDGTMQGFDMDLIDLVNNKTSVPVIVCGGAGQLDHISKVLDSGITAVAAGSLFVFKGKHRAVLINYPQPKELNRIIS